MVDLYFEQPEVIEGTPEELARRWLGIGQPPHITLELHPRIVEAFAGSPLLTEALIACGQAESLTERDRWEINQFAALLKAIGAARREQAQEGGSHGGK